MVSFSCGFHPPTGVDIDRAVNFCIRQLGKEFSLAPKLFEPPQTSISSETWYCSEMVWAAYNYAGYDISYKGDIEQFNDGFIGLMNEAAMSPTEIVLGGASKATTHFKMYYEKEVDNLGSGLLKVRWCDLPFVKGYTTYVARNGLRYVDPLTGGYLYVPSGGDIDELSTTYNNHSLFDAIALSFSTTNIIGIRPNNRYHNGEFPYSVLNCTVAIMKHELNRTILGSKAPL